MTRTRGVYMLDPRHAGGLAALAATPGPADCGALARALHEQGAAAFVAARVAERQAGIRHTFAIEDGGQLLGLCELRVAGDGRGEVDVWVAGPLRRRGHGAFAVGRLVEFAFTNLRLPVVVASVPDGNEAAQRLLENHGFELQPRATAAEAGRTYAIGPAGWRARRDAPALAVLVPGLRAILDAELAAGNEIAETSTGWPDSGSVLVRLRRPFLAAHAALPPGIRYAEPCDPHWWKAEYASDSPRQLVVH